METFCQLLAPVPVAITSTALSVNYSVFIVPPGDGYTRINTTLIYNEVGDNAKTTLLLDSSKQAIEISGLKKYTEYTFMLEQFGNLYIMESPYSTQRTLEGGMCLSCTIPVALYVIYFICKHNILCEHT